MLSIAVHNPRQTVQVDHPAGPIEIGREGPGDLPRVVIDDCYVSRTHLRAEELPGGRVRVQNVSARNPVLLPNDTVLGVGEAREFGLPMRLTIGESTIDLRLASAAAVPSAAPAVSPSVPVPRTEGTANPADTVPVEERPLPGDVFRAEGYQALRPVRNDDPQQTAPGEVELGETPSPDRLARWMETVLALQRSDVALAEFYAQTARALIGMVGLDVGLVLRRRERDWQVVARAARGEERRPGISGREYSETVLRQVLAERQTFFQDLAQMRSQESLSNVGAVVVSPIFGLKDEVVGALYGLRWWGGWGQASRVRPLEAQLVQLLAAAVGANLARTAATRTRTQFEQFFSPELVRELSRNPALLEGHAQEITVLMADLRGFSTLSERLGPQETCRLVRDVMERLSERVVQHGGVIVSYLGDGLLAMWNAPVAQPDHAARACRAALAMLGEVPALNATWGELVGQPLGIGVGINTGPAHVGNTGSSRKFMYGPLGNTVNLCSRVEGATKHLKVPVLLTGSTRSALGDAFATRRLGQVRVAGIRGAVDLYELHGETGAPEWRACRDTYEAALALYETRQWLRACQTLLPLMEQSERTGNYDRPTLNLMKRSLACLESTPEPFDPVLELTGK